MNVWDQYRHEKRHLRPLLTTARVRTFEVWPVWRLTFLFEGSESVWANFSRNWKCMSKLFRYSIYKFLSPEFGTDACLGRWYGSCAPGRHDKTFAFYNRRKNFLNCELIFYSFWKSRLKEVMIQRATILGEYSPLQETGRNIKMTKWGGCRQFCNLSLNQTMGAWGQNCFFFSKRSLEAGGGFGGSEVSGPIISFHIGKVKIQWKLFPKEGTGGSPNCLPEPK